MVDRHNTEVLTSLERKTNSILLTSSAFSGQAYPDPKIDLQIAKENVMNFLSTKDSSDDAATDETLELHIGLATPGLREGQNRCNNKVVPLRVTSGPQEHRHSTA